MKFLILLVFLLQGCASVTLSVHYESSEKFPKSFVIDGISFQHIWIF